MTTFQDCSVGLGKESTFGTGVTPTRWFEFTGESFGYDKGLKQGEGLRVGSRVARSNRRVITTSDAGGDFDLECVSKGMGLLWEQCMGTGVSTLVAATTYQQNFTLGDTLPSATWQKGLPRFDGAITTLTYNGSTVDSWELGFGNGDIATLSLTVDARDVTSATAYATPSYPVGGNLFHFANGSLSTGTLTPPTTTVLASATTPLASVRSGNVKLTHNVNADRYNFGGGGKKSKPQVGLREISGALSVELDSATFVDAVLNDTPMSLLLNFTAGSLSTGLETLQVVLPEIKFDGNLPNANGGDEILVDLEFAALDNLTAAQPIWVVCRTSDSAL